MLPARPASLLTLPAGRPGGGRAPRRAALGLAVLGLVVLGVGALTGRLGRSEAARGDPAAGGSASPRSAASEARSAGAPARQRASARAPEARPPSSRVVPPSHAAALFARHSWYVAPPPRPAPPPAPPPPEPEPTAPPLPYAFVGSYAPSGDQPVYFLARGDRVIDAHVGDRLDGVYQLEAAAGGQLVFVYLPLHVRQNLAAGVSK